MVLRDVPESEKEFNIYIDGKTIHVDRDLLSWHPGGSAITTYRNLDATTVFHTFHVNSKRAYQSLHQIVQKQGDEVTKVERMGVASGVDEVEEDDLNMGRWDMSDEESAKICKSFERLRHEVRQQGLLNGETSFFVRKFGEVVAIMATSLFLQGKGFYVCSALLMGLAWQQLGWMIHEYTHHQHFKNHWWNDLCSYVVGNLMQGFSSGGWKEQHNVHHAATNVVGRDGDIDLMPLWATVPSDLKHLEDGPSKTIWAYIIPYQHIYWTFALPFLRLSWLVQSIIFVGTMRSNFYQVHRERATLEQVTLSLHWILVAIQYYFLPDLYTRLVYFAVSQLFGGFLIAHVVTYNHYSTEKFPNNAKILSNYACLQLYTTRNMQPGLFIDWLWGGLNYQIEHHLFPTAPRHHLRKIMPLVKRFCEENGLPYMVDDYFTGWANEIEQFKRIATLASQMLTERNSVD